MEGEFVFDPRPAPGALLAMLRLRMATLVYRPEGWEDDFLRLVEAMQHVTARSLADTFIAGATTPGIREAWTRRVDATLRRLRQKGLIEVIGVIPSRLPTHGRPKGVYAVVGKAPERVPRSRA